MLTESIGGQCPNCGYKKCYIRYGSVGYFHVQACPRCGFGYGAAWGDMSEPHEEWHTQLWATITTMEKLTRREFYDKYKEYDTSDEPVQDMLFKFTPDDVEEFRKLKLPVYED